MRKILCCFSALAVPVLLCGALKAQDDSKPDLSGTWQLNPQKSDMQLNRFSGLTMVIAEKDGKINITETEKLVDGKERKVIYDCTTDGKDCKVRDEAAKASFWYNGPMLVSMETKKNGSEVLRERMKLSPDAKELNVEVSSLVPQTDKKDKLVLDKR